MTAHPTDDLLREALEKLHHAVCGETGFAAAVRQESGKAYPWPALDIADELARAALAAAPQPAPAWNGPGDKPHTYSPDYQAMGDCRVCGHDYEAHQKAPQPAPEREELVRLLQIITRNGSLDDGRTLHEVIADALLARGLRLPGGDETMAWGVVGEDGAVVPSLIRESRSLAATGLFGRKRVVRVAIRVVEDGGE